MQSMMNSFPDSEVVGKRCSGPSSAALTDLSVDVTHNLREMPSASERSLPYNTSGNLNSNLDEPPAQHHAFDSIVLRATPGDEHAESNSNNNNVTRIIGPFLRSVDCGPTGLTWPTQQLQLHSWLPQDTTQAPSELSLQTEKCLTSDTTTAAAQGTLNEQADNRATTTAPQSDAAGLLPREGNEPARHVTSTASLDAPVHHPMSTIAQPDSRNHSMHSDAFPGSYSASANQNVSSNANNTSGSQPGPQPGLSYNSPGHMMMMMAQPEHTSQQQQQQSLNQANTSVDQSQASHEMAGLMAPGASLTHPMGFSITSSLFETSCTLPAATLTHPTPPTALTNMRSDASSNNNNNATTNNRSSCYTINNNNNMSSGAMASGFGSETALPQYASYSNNANNAAVAMPFGSLPRNTSNALLANTAPPSAGAATLMPVGTTAMMMMTSPEARLSSPALMTTMGGNTNNNTMNNANAGSSGSNDTSPTGVSPQSLNLAMEANHANAGATQGEHSLTGPNGHVPEDVFRSNLFVCGLSPEVRDEQLRQLFQRYGEIESAKVMLDIHTGRSRCIAFVKFKEAQSASQALKELNGSVVYGHPITVREANSRAAYLPGNPTNKTFVRNVPPSVTKEALHAYFSQFGEVIDISIHSDTAAHRSATSNPVLGASAPGSMLSGSMSLAGASFSLANASNSYAVANGLLPPPPPPPPPPPSSTSTTMPLSALEVRRNIVFITFATMEAAALAAEKTHTTMPFPECEGVPLLAKVAEDSLRRTERLARRLRSSLTSATPGNNGSATGPFFAPPGEMCMGAGLAMPGPFGGRMYGPMLTAPLATAAAATLTPTTLTSPPNAGLFEFHPFAPPPPPPPPGNITNNNNTHNGGGAATTTSAAGPFVPPTLLYATASKPSPTAGLPFMTAAAAAAGNAASAPGPMLYTADRIGLTPPTAQAQGPMVFFTGPVSSAAPPRQGPQAMPILYTTAPPGTLPTTTGSAAASMPSAATTPPGTQATLLPPPPPPGMPTMMSSATPTLVAFPGGQAAPYYVVMNGY